MWRNIDKEEVWEAWSKFSRATNAKSNSAVTETNKPSAIINPKDPGSDSYTEHDPLTALQHY